jgi:ferredoxin-NADP reductase
MGAQTVKLRSHSQVAKGTFAFHFDKPAGFEFVAGQSIDLTLIEPPQTDAEGNTRAFSLASAPFEPDLMVATRMRDTAFKRVLSTLTPGTEVKIEGPFGSMTLHRNPARPAVFLAGGIGITPFRSMITQAANSGVGRRVFLFYSNRRPEDAAFLAELQDLVSQHPSLTLLPVMTNPVDSPAWNGEKGHISKEMLARYLMDVAKPIYYIAGPPALVGAMKGILNEFGVEEDEINSEDFSGY